MSAPRLTIMYRADISNDRARELIGADDASIISWNDPFAERAALAQRCREQEHRCGTLGLELENSAGRQAQAERKADALRAEVERLRKALERIHCRAEAYMAEDRDMAVSSVAVVEEIARTALEGSQCAATSSTPPAA